MTKDKLRKLIEQLPVEPEDNILGIDVHPEGSATSH